MFEYFTVWNVLLVIFHKYTHRYVDLLFTTTIVLVVGWGSIHLNTRYVYKEQQLVAKDVGIIVLDMLMHVIPFIFVCVYYRKFYASQIIPACTAIVILLVYVVWADVERLYSLSQWTLAFLFCVGFLFYLWLKA